MIERQRSVCVCFYYIYRRRTSPCPMPSFSSFLSSFLLRRFWCSFFLYFLLVSSECFSRTAEPNGKQIKKMNKKLHSLWRCCYWRLGEIWRLEFTDWTRHVSCIRLMLTRIENREFPRNSISRQHKNKETFNGFGLAVIHWLWVVDVIPVQCPFNQCNLRRTFSAFPLFPSQLHMRG